MGKREFIERIYIENADFIKAIIKNRLYSKKPQDISDCVHDVFLIALKSAGLEDHVNVKGWLCETAKIITQQYNTKYLKENNLRRNFLDSDIIVEDFSVQFIEDELFNEAIDKDVHKRVMESLSYHDRAFYDLRYVQKLDYDKICRITGKTESALWVQNARLKAKISEFIKLFVKKM